MTKAHWRHPRTVATKLQNISTHTHTHTDRRKAVPFPFTGEQKEETPRCFGYLAGESKELLGEVSWGGV